MKVKKPHMFIYLAILTVVVVLASAFFNQPVENWLRTGREQVELNERQRILIRYDDRTIIIKAALTNFMSQQQASLSRVRVGLIHGIGTSLQWDLVAVVARADHSLGALLSNLPLSQWDDYITQLVNGRCAYVRLSDITNPAEVARLQAVKIEAFLVCPILNTKGQLLGAVTGSWDAISDVPPDQSNVRQSLQMAAKQIGDYMSVHGSS